MYQDFDIIFVSSISCFLFLHMCKGFIIDKKTINFHLVTETLPCDTEYWGIAENKYWDGDGEVDEDNNEGYFADEYFKEEKEYIIGIRLAEDLNKVKIKFIQKSYCTNEHTIISIINLNLN